MYNYIKYGKWFDRYCNTWLLIWKATNDDVAGMNLAKYTNTHAVDLPAKQVHISEILRGNEFFRPF